MKVLSVPVAVIVEGIVAGQGKQHAKTRTKREEDLRSCIHPYLQNIRHSKWGVASVETETRKWLNKLITVCKWKFESSYTNNLENSLCFNLGCNLGHWHNRIGNMRCLLTSEDLCEEKCVCVHERVSMSMRAFHDGKKF